jgi:hypothetical protein
MGLVLEESETKRKKENKAVIVLSQQIQQIQQRQYQK